MFVSNVRLLACSVCLSPSLPPMLSCGRCASSLCKTFSGYFHFMFTAQMRVCVCATIAIHSCFTHAGGSSTVFNFCIYLLSMPYLRWRLMRGYPTVSRPPFVHCGRRRLMKLACCPPTPLLPDTGDRGSYGETGDLAAACAALKSVLCHGHRRGHA